MHPDDALSRHFRLSPAHEAALRHLGLRTIRDLLYHLPSRYDEAGNEARAAFLEPGAKVTLVGVLHKIAAKKLWKSRRTATEGVFEDGSGRVKVVWFNQPYIASYVHEGVPVRITGTVSGSPGKTYIANPTVAPAEALPEGIFSEGEERHAAGLFPVYPETKGITSRWLYHALKRIFEADAHAELEDPIPADVRARLTLPDLPAALLWIHRPEKREHAEAARKRFAFEEIFAIHTARAQERREDAGREATAIPDARARAASFLAAQDVQPTGAQRRSIDEICADLARPHPMARLLEGDVGSGKTLVAAAAAYTVVTSRPAGRQSGTLQVAYMAPTEILAQQHFESFIRYFAHLPINIALLTGSGCRKFPSKVSKESATKISRAQLLKWVENGEVAVLIGTHALVQQSVRFKHLALAIVDEQHRFGTRQRLALARKHHEDDTEQLGKRVKLDAVRGAQAKWSEPYTTYGERHFAQRNEEMCRFHALAPHFLSMTATPIPRTLALTIYGNLDLSVIDELPPGRVAVSTSIVKPDGRAAMYERIRTELAAGRQAYVICPRIDEPDPQKQNALMAKSAKAEAARLQKDVFPEYRIGLLHGAMTPAQKDATMREFATGEMQILVATSVVEVGVNVPNATVIAIEGAERFGLSQLHQLRGRVQRSSHPPHCFLVPDTTSAFSLKRLRALEKSSDGFALAETDLELRGAGDLYGRQQWGMSDLGMEALKNPRLIAAARDAAAATVAKDPSLASHPALAARAARVSAQLHVE